MAMRAYFDESGLNPHEDLALVIAGFLGSPDEWQRVATAWTDCLFSPPRISYFKNDEAKGLHGEFSGLSRVIADQKKNDLAQIVGTSKLQGFCISVRHELLAHRVPAATKRTAGSRTYDWGFFTATSGVLQYVRDHYPEETVDFIFDERRELGQCISLFNRLKELASGDTPWGEVFSRAGTCTSADDKKTVALQMGDLLAGEFSGMGNSGNAPTEAWRRLATLHGIAHIRCDMPWPIPILVALQGMGKQITDASGKILKRIYKDRERSPELLKECDDLIAKQILFETALKYLTEIHEEDEGFKRFRELMRSEDDRI